MNSLHYPADDAITSRRSVRRFLPTPVPRAEIAAILDAAARAPSGTNMQPWRGYVLVGAARDALCAAVQAVFDAAEQGHHHEVRYYPDTFFEPYLSRRREGGWDLYGRLGIARGESGKMQAQHRRNFQFFDAPVGMVFTIHRELATGSWLDYGMFLENVMIAARARGNRAHPLTKRSRCTALAGSSGTSAEIRCDITQRRSIPASLA